MAEDEAQRLVRRQQPLLFLHYEVIHLVVGLGIAACILENALPVLREIPVVESLERQFEPIELRVAHVFREFSKRRFKGLGEPSFHRLTGTVVVSVIRDAADEKQAQDLDSPLPDLKILFKMLLYCGLDLRAPDVVAHAAGLFAKTQDTAVIELDVFVARQRGIKVL